MTKPLSPDQLAELRNLIFALYDQTIEPEDSARLEEWICHHEEARRLYVQYMHLHARLYWDTKQEPEGAPELSQASAPPAPQSPVLGFLADTFDAGVKFFTRGIVVSLMFTVVLPVVLLVVLLLNVAREPVPPNPQQSIAVAPKDVVPADEIPAAMAKVTKLYKCKWGKGAMPLSVGAVLSSKQQILLTAGLLEITFTDGAAVLLEGPVAFDVDNNRQGYLQVGNLVANVPKGAEGFTIETASAKIVDLGTNFGVSVDTDGTVEAHVFKGEIEVETKQTAKDATSSKMRFTKGQAAKIPRSQPGQALQIIAMASSPNRFAHSFPGLVEEPKKPESQLNTCFAHRGDTNPVTEGWKLWPWGENKKLKQDAPPALAPVNDDGIAAWMIDNRIPQKGFTYKSNITTQEGGLTPEIFKLGRDKGWVFQARFKTEEPVVRKPTSPNTSAFAYYHDGKRLWAVFVRHKSDGSQRIRFLGETSKGKDFQTILPNSRNRYIDYEIRYDPKTEDAKVFIDGKLFLSKYVGRPQTKEKERGLAFGVQKSEAKACFALVEWRVLDEPPVEEQRRGN